METANKSVAQTAIPMPPTGHTPAPPEPELGPAFLESLGHGDPAALERLLAPDVWLRALLVRVMREANEAREAVEALRGWTRSARGRRMVDSDHHVMAGREFVRYRFLLCPAFAPETWHLVEQSGYLRVRDGRISRLDLVCTGYHAIDDAAAARLLAAPGPGRGAS